MTSFNNTLGCLFCHIVIMTFLSHGHMDAIIRDWIRRFEGFDCRLGSHVSSHVTMRKNNCLMSSYDNNTLLCIMQDYRPISLYLKKINQKSTHANWNGSYMNKNTHALKLIGQEGDCLSENSVSDANSLFTYNTFPYKPIFKVLLCTQCIAI